MVTAALRPTLLGSSSSLSKFVSMAPAAPSPLASAPPARLQSAACMAPSVETLEPVKAQVPYNTLVPPPAAPPVGRLWSSEPGIIAVGGHRGMGENLFLEVGNSACGIRENTLASFLQAAASGASFVELDVQVTRDGVPVIWHDDLVLTQGGEGIEEARFVSDFTLDEFKGLLTRPGGVLRNFKGADGERIGVRPWRQPLEGDLPTLAEVFEGVPTSVGINIEVKMTTPDTVTRTPETEVERIVGPLLAVAAKHAQQEQQEGQAPRTVMFSSFDPEVCVALRQRLPASNPVLFLSGGGKYMHVDPRRTSVAAAADFAVAAGLQGVVLETGTLRKQEAQIAAVRTLGLQLYTYGQQNSDAEWLRRQFFLGVQGAIVDDVPGVVQSLTASPVSM